MPIKKLTAIAAIAIASIGAAQAQGPYAGIGYTQFSLDGGSFGSVKPSSAIFKVGYDIDETWAIEGRASTGSSSDSIRMSGVNVDVKLDSYFGVYTKGTLPLSASASVYGLVGYNAATAKASAMGINVSDDQNGGSYGVGLDFHATKNLSVGIEWLRHFSDTTSFGAGVTYKF